MTDMRNPLTMEFHKARRRADLLRPENANDLDGDRDAQLEYRDAVHDYMTPSKSPNPKRSASVAAASRTRTSSGSRGPRTCSRLAEDDAATPQERQSAYARARTELDGILVLPAATRASIERRIAGEIEA